MREKEPKFSEAEIAKKQEEAQEMDKKAKEMMEKGEAKLDENGYPVPRKEALMTVAAEDELARVEAAMEELER